MDDLEGITVVAVEQAVAAPYASCKLAQAGARVIKIERKDGDFARKYDHLVRDQSAYFVWLNHGKESVCLDLKNRDDLMLLLQILREADVFIQNLAPGAAHRLGLGAICLRRNNPSLICCSISGYGSTGPRAEQKAYDLLIQAETGLAGITGSPDGPGRVGVSVCDIAAGMTAHASILQALFARTKTGVGQDISISLFQATADWMNVPYLQFKYGQKAPTRHGLKHPTIAPYGAFSCKDERQLLISIQNEREWERLCRAILDDQSIATDPKFSTNIKRVANRTELDGLLANAFLMRTCAENISLLKAARIAYGRLSDLTDLDQHPQKSVLTIQSGNGPIELLAPSAVISGRTLIGGTVPELGAHTDKIRREFSE